MANKPKIRFNEFSDEWEEKELSEITEQYNEPVETPTNGYVRLGIRSHAKGTFHEYVPAGQELETAQMSCVRKDKLIFNITFAWEHAVAITDKDDEGKLVSQRFPQFTLSNEIFTDFFKYAILDEKFRHKLWLSSPGGAGRNRVLNIKEAFEYIVKYPKAINEQKLIGEFFNSISSLITSTQVKLDKTIILKKSMLEKMFPQEDAKVPELRFAGFSGNWEEKTLNEYLEVVTDKNEAETYGKEDVLSVSGDYGVVNQIEYQGKSLAGASLVNYGIAHTGDVVYTKSPLKEQPYGIIKTNKGKTGIVSALYGIFSRKGEILTDFIQYYFESDKRLNEYLRPLVNKGAKNTLLVSDEDSIKGIVHIPEIKEQQLIINFFDNCTKLINDYRLELEKLKTIKKSLLEKMFV